MGNAVREETAVASSNGGGGAGVPVLPDWDGEELITVRENGALSYEGAFFGEFDPVEKRLVLNLGWMRMAGLKLTVEGDPKTDKRRIVLARPTEVKRMEGGDQESLPL